jgi:hypothetical protein
MWGLLAIVFGCATIVCAQSEPAEKSSDANTKGTITGRVVDENGQPMPNTQVSISGYGGSARQVVTSDADGKFRATDLSRMSYLISASSPAYVARPRDPDLDPIGYYHIGDSVRLEMMKGGVITGSVTRANGEPIVSISVYAYMIRDYRGQAPRYSSPVGRQQTDDRGIYRIYGLASGTYIVAAGGGRASGYQVNPFAMDAVTFAPSSTRDTAAEVSVNAGEEDSGVDIRYRDEPGHTVSGTVANANAADQEQGFTIMLTSVLNGLEQTAASAYQPGGTHGFMFTGVADGDYQVIAQTYSPAGGWSLSESQRVRVKDADLTGIELTVKPLASIRGAVVLEDSKVAECQGKRRPVFGEIVIGAYHNEKNVAKDQPQSIWGLGAPVTPDGQGTFTLRNLAAGQYRFITRPSAKYWYLRSIAWPSTSKAAQANRPLDAARNWTTVKTADKLSGLNITFAAGAASLQGRIETSAGKLPPRAFVYLAPAEPEQREDILRYFVSLAAEDGTFDLGNIPPGSYWVIARAATTSDTNMQSKMRLPDEAELRAKILHDGEAAQNQAELKPCQNLTAYKLPFRE